MTIKTMKYLHLLSVCLLILSGIFVFSAKALAQAPCVATYQLPSMDDPTGGSLGTPCSGDNGGVGGISTTPGIVGGYRGHHFRVPVILFPG